ncbi:MAG: signal peptide peptidase SppA [Planctomycetaceae bacterium]|nr:signal peptide peptidase SppA [Planctomycetaceae bacterium]
MTSPLPVQSSADALPLASAPIRRGGWVRLGRWCVWTILIISVGLNVVLWSLSQTWFGESKGVTERFHSGNHKSKSKLAIIEISGTIMPPFTSRTLKAIKHAKEDDAVKGVLLQIDSPGGFVSDSHQIYNRLKELAEKKPIYVSMKSLAASGGYYVAMGAGEDGKIYAEPTTWTGSIGVIIPRYELVGLKEKLGIDSKPLKTGEFKDALNPFSPLSDREKAVWDNILQQSFSRFITVIDDNRKKLNRANVTKLATGQIYTADDALKIGLIDAIGYEEDALTDLADVAQVTDPQIVKYEHHSGLVDLLLGSKAQLDPAVQWRNWLEATVPRAMFYFSWAPVVPHE